MGDTEEKEDEWKGWFDDPTEKYGFTGVDGSNVRIGTEKETSDEVEAKVAAAYEDDLSGSNGPVARMRAQQELSALAAQEVVDGALESSGLYSLKTTSSGGPDTVNPRSVPFGAKDTENIETPAIPYDEPWSIVAEQQDETTAVWKLIPGRIYRSYGDLDDTDSLMTIAAVDDPLTIAADNKIWLELTDIGEDPPILTLKSGAVGSGLWDEYPKTFLTEDDGDFNEEVTKAYFLLWEFFDAADVPALTYGIRVSSGIWGRQAVRAPNLAMVWGIHNFDLQYRKLHVPILVPMG